MKKVVIFLALIISSCAFKLNMSTVPPGAKRCGNDGACADGEYCGFYGVDSPPVCKPKPKVIRWQ